MAYQAAKNAWGSKSSFITQAAKQPHEANFTKYSKELTALVAALSLSTPEERKLKEDFDKLMLDQTRILNETLTQEKLKKIQNEINKNSSFITSFRNRNDAKSAQKYEDNIRNLLAENAEVLASTGEKGAKLRADMEKLLPADSAPVAAPAPASKPAVATPSSAPVAKPAAASAPASSTPGVDVTKIKQEITTKKNQSESALSFNRYEQAATNTGVVLELLQKYESDLKSSPAGQAVYDEFTNWHNTFVVKVQTKQDEEAWGQISNEFEIKLAKVERMLNAKNEAVLGVIEELQQYVKQNQQMIEKFKGKKDYAQMVADVEVEAKGKFASAKQAEEDAAAKAIADEIAAKERNERIKAEVKKNRADFLATKKPVEFEMTASEAGTYRITFNHGANEYTGDTYDNFFAKRQVDLLAGTKYVEPNVDPVFCYEGDMIDISLEFPRALLRKDLFFRSKKIPMGTKKVVVTNMNFEFQN